MVNSDQLGYVLIAVGVCVALLSAGFGSATERACTIDSVVYDRIGIHPSGVAITDVEFATATIEWYDGCNWHTNSLVPLVLGLLVSASGIRIVHSNRTADSETDQ